MRRTITQRRCASGAGGTPKAQHHTAPPADVPGSIVLDQHTPFAADVSDVSGPDTTGATAGHVDETDLLDPSVPLDPGGGPPHPGLWFSWCSLPRLGRVAWWWSCGFGYRAGGESVHHEGGAAGGCGQSMMPVAPRATAVSAAAVGDRLPFSAHRGRRRQRREVARRGSDTPGYARRSARVGCYRWRAAGGVSERASHGPVGRASSLRIPLGLHPGLPGCGVGRPGCSPLVYSVLWWVGTPSVVVVVRLCW